MKNLFPFRSIGAQEQDYNWSRKPYLPHIFEAVKFEEEFGPKIQITEDPIDIFKNFFSEGLKSKIVAESNLYAPQKGAVLELSNEELRAFLGILVIMGFDTLPSMRHNWSSDQNLHKNRISDITSLKRFLKILGYLHVNDNQLMIKKGDPGYDKPHKVRPLLDLLSKSFLNCISPSRNLSVDESMVAFKGRTMLKQYMPQKPIKRGIKVWALACAKTGYLLKLLIYEGKRDSMKVVLLELT